MSLTTLPSGLMYEVITQAPASAATAQAGSVVTVHYTGWLQSSEGQASLGKKFDSSVDRGQKFSFILGAGQVIKGWDEGVAGMKIGEKRRLVIPPQLGYGNRSIANIIPANSTLIFDVELFDVK